MTSLDPATIAALLKKDNERKAPVNQAASREGLVYCDFCKGYYNEYHFGDIDEEGGES